MDQRAPSHPIPRLTIRYHFELAIEAGCNAYAAPLGFLEAGARDFAGEIPLILKTNDNDVLREEKDPNQALTASVQDALRLAAARSVYDLPGIGAPARDVRTAPRLCRGGKTQRARGRRLVLSARVGSEQGWRNSDRRCRLRRPDRGSARGAHHQGEAADGAIEQEAARKVYDERRIPIATPAERVRHVVDCAFAGRRIVIFSGGAAVFDDDKLLDEIRSIHAGGGFGSIIGRNSFQRPKEEALRMLGAVMDIYATAPDRDRTH